MRDRLAALDGIIVLDAGERVGFWI